MRLPFLADLAKAGTIVRINAIQDSQSTAAICDDAKAVDQSTSQVDASRRVVREVRRIVKILTSKMLDLGQVMRQYRVGYTIRLGREVGI